MTLPPYETLELVVPEVQLRERYRRGWLVVATIVAFVAGLLIAYAASRTEQGPASTAPALSPASHVGGSLDPRKGNQDRLTSVGLLAEALPASGAGSLSGYATWYDVAPGNAAAGPDLRAWLGDWRGQTVKVCHGGCIFVSLTDWCQCRDRSGKPTLVDLSRADFAVLGDPSAGVISVTVSRGGAVALPATDTATDNRGFGILLIVALVFWFAFGLAYWALTTRLRLGRDRREHRRREHR